MTMQDFLALFYTNAQARYRAMALAQQAGGTLFSDLAFLAAVHQWRNGKHGKKNFQQIYTVFLIRTRGGQTPNPYVISPATQQPPPACITALAPVRDSVLLQNRANAQTENEITRLKGEGVMGSLKAFHASTLHKIATPTRTIDKDAFDGVVAGVTAAGSPLANWVAGLHLIPNNVFLNANQMVQDLIRMLQQGQAGGHMDAREMGLLA
jgi:hypothetical protein